MPFEDKITDYIYNYCNNHLPEEGWYQNELDFIEDDKLRTRLIQEFKSIRFAYKLYEGIQASEENHIFQIRYQIFAYASLYEDILEYVIKNYKLDDENIKKIHYICILKRFDIPYNQKKIIDNMTHDGKKIIPCYIGSKKLDYSKIKFEEKCKAAEHIGLIKKIDTPNGICDLPKDIITIYSIRNGIHILAEQKKNIEYEIGISKKAYKRMKPFIEQIKNKLQIDKKSIYRYINIK